MAQRRPSYRSPSSSLARSRYTRRHHHSRRRAAVSFKTDQPTLGSHDSTPPSSPTLPRPVLVPLHLNLRRLPSRLNISKAYNMRYASTSQAAHVGEKRKRVAASNENAHNGARLLKSHGRFKRQRSSQRTYNDDDDEVTSAMDVDDTLTPVADSDSSGEDDAVGSTDDHLINEAPPKQLLRLRKDDLVNLFSMAGLRGDAELLTKPDIVESIVAAREENPHVPPSTRSSSCRLSDSDDGNAAGGEETDYVASKSRSDFIPIRRRATVNEARSKLRLPQKRSVSMEIFPVEARKLTRANGGVDGDKRRRGSRESTSAPPNAALALPSPPHTRLRPRKPTNEAVSNGSSKGKGKSKQVDFASELQNGLRRNIRRPNRNDEEQTDEAELVEELTKISPSPRRLRSKGQKEVDERVLESCRRITRPRRAKSQSASSKDETREDDGADEEEDELVSSASVTPPSSGDRHTPLKRRLRPRRIPQNESVEKCASDGDDEDEPDGEDDSEGDEEDGDDQNDIIETSEEDAEEEEAEEAEEEVEQEAEEEMEQEVEQAEADYGDAEDTIITEPRRLRNGKIVGDDDAGVEDAEEEEADEEMIANDMVSVAADGESEEENEDTDELMEDLDLTAATARTLVRLRREDLVKMCETRDLDPVGTKPQLAEALLLWRDRHSTECSSPSSTGTIRPPSTKMSRRTQKSDTPILFKSHHVHMDEPRTPPISSGKKDVEPELELDLESLGLEDREIPPDKLTKLEKIGSGGFKDVFVGKFKGRKIAIAEFRGQLNTMDIKELKLLGGFNHPNIVRFLGVSIPENTRETPVMIVSELCANGDLFDYIRNVSPPPLPKVLSMMLDIARGLEYLHLRKPSVIHRDCKSSNILITAKGVAKIADFGLAKVKQSTRSMVRSLVGTVNWQAPELWHAHPKYNYKVDVFSCAMVYWETLQWHIPNKKFPWEGLNEHAIYELVGAKRQRPSVSGLRKQWSPEIVELIERMWVQDPQDRPTMSEVVEELEALVHRYR